MEHIFAVESKEEFERYKSFAERSRSRIDEFIEYLELKYEVRELPRAIVWTNKNIATKLISDIPIPAYTNDYRIVITPDVQTWSEIYKKQLDSYEACEAAELQSHYDGVSENHVLKILGHELAHHSALFPDTDYEDGIWFEEGMVEYISREYFLNEDEFAAESAINKRLVELFKAKHGEHPLEQFGKATYEGDYAGIFYEYWRSFLAVEQIVSEQKGDVSAVFDSFREWQKCSNGQTLTEWFGVNI